MPFNVVIRRMEPMDLEEVLAMEQETSLVPWTRQMFVGEMLNPYSHCYVLESDRRTPPLVIGFICFRHLGQESEILNLCIHPKYRSIGLGRQLMQFYIDSCKEAGVARSYLEVNSANHPAIRLYQDFSYRPVGRRLKYYGGRWDALVMVRGFSA